MQQYGVPHVILRAFVTMFYKNKFQNPQIFQQTISLFPEHSTLLFFHVVAQVNLFYWLQKGGFESKECKQGIGIYKMVWWPLICLVGQHSSTAVILATVCHFPTFCPLV
jgi:hypothetical protein